MHILEPKQLAQHRHHLTKKQKQLRRQHFWTGLIIIVVAGYIVAALAVPLSPLDAETKLPSLPVAQPVSLPWPSYGQAAVGAVGYGLLDKHGDQKPLPTASVGKVLTAVAVLKIRPIYQGQTGPTITITAQDVALYNRFAADNQSVVKVEVGEQLTEYQALQALLLPSANNMADVLARWAFGSTDNYLAFVNPFTKTLGMTNTHMADASGFLPQTTSTASDLTKLAEIAMNQPVIAEIVNQAQADLPVAGTVFNVNRLIGHDGIIGIKTGNTDEAGGCYMFAARRDLESNQTVTVVGVIMGAPDLAQAIEDAKPLMDETFKGFEVVHIAQADAPLGTINQAGGKQVPISVPSGLFVTVWRPQTPRMAVVVNKLKSTVTSGDEVGTLSVNVGNLSYSLPVVANGTITSHSIPWRIRHLAGYW